MIDTRTDSGTGTGTGSGIGTGRAPRRIGHKGADAIRSGNTIQSFEEAVTVGVDMIEFDVLRPVEDSIGGESAARSPLIIAHDWHDARRRACLTLTEALDAFTRPPLDRVELDIDLKLPGREDELVDALASAGLTARTMISTMYVESLDVIGRHEPRLRRGWTYPKVTRPWDQKRWARPFVALALRFTGVPLPRIATRRIAAHALDAVWVYHPLITEALVDAVHEAGAELMAWTVDDRERIERLCALGVDGICSNDPRLLQGL